MTPTDVVNAQWDRIEAWLSENAPHVLAALYPGATDAEIDEAEKELAVVFPEDMRASYRRHDGAEDKDGAGVLAVHLYPLVFVKQDWHMMREIAAEHFAGLSSGEYDAGIKPLAWSEKWLPVAAATDVGDRWCVDFDPAPGGRIGQIFFWDHETYNLSLEAPGFAEWLTAFADDLEAGNYVVHEDYTGIVPLWDT